MSTKVINEETQSPREQENSEKNYRATTPYNTIIILAAVIAVFLSQQLISMESVVYLGGLVKPIFAQGEYWRLLTASVIHDGVFHVGFNGYALFILGKLVEIISAKANVPVVFLISAVTGGLLSFAFLPNGTSVGASGGVIGLLGFLTVYSYRRRKLLSNAMFKNMLFNIVFIAVVGVFVLPNIDNYGHLGGLLAGGLYGIFQIPDDLHQDPRDAGPLLQKAGVFSLAVILVTAFAAILMFVSWYLVTGDLVPLYQY